MMKKAVIWILLILIGLYLLSAVIMTPISWIGLLITVFGLYQVRQRNKGKVTFSKPGWIVGTGIILTFILAVAFVEPTEETVKDTDTMKQEEKDTDESPSTQKQQTEEELAEAQRLEEEQEAKEEAEKLTAEQKAHEEAARLAEEQRKKDEAERLAEEQRKKEEEQRLAEEQAPEPEPVQTYESYKNCTALNAVYPNGVDSSHPAYASKHDRDKDGYACEQN